MSVQKLLVVGGNGFLGSAVCKAAVAKGWDVSSISSSGKAYTTPAGHTPKWVSSVSWHAGSAFEPSSYRSLLESSTAVVHTLGILLEDAGYKKAVQDGNVWGLVKAFAATANARNPLRTEEERRKGYEGMNRDSALTVLDTYLSTIPPNISGPANTGSSGIPSSSSESSSSSSISRAFVYISAADAFRPLVPSRYLETKREAEFEILRRCERAESGVKPVFIRPGLMYHPHIRPYTTLPAFLIDLTSKIGLPNPFASKSPLHGALSAMSTHPLHVDHVASAVIKSIDEGREGVVDVQEMREWAGFKVGRGKVSTST